MPMTAGDVSADDFPQLWERPSFEALLTCLGHLHIEPPIWNAAVSGTAPRENRAKSARHHREVISYLAGIVSNGLRWIEDDDQKEVIWEAASRCLSQRCGRAGMGEVTRTWPFQGRQVPFELIIREPPITGDSLGHKTWGSSFLMAQLLDSFAFEHLAHLLTLGGRESLSVLELGSGTGLLGIAAAAMWQAEVVLSDLPDIMPNLVYNIEQNRDTVEHLGGKVHSGILTWGPKIGNDTRFSCENNFDVGIRLAAAFWANIPQIILAADGIYDDEHPILLSSAIHTQLRDSPNSRAIVMAPIRDEVTKNLIAQFRSNMKTGTLSLEVLAEQTLTGQDDWGDGDDSQLVECWWAVFGKQST